MLLTLDIGNSRIKAGIFDAAGGLIETFLVESEAKLNLLLNKADATVVSNVGQLPQELIGQPKVTVVDSTTPIPLSNLYATPQSLGTDRLCAAIGAWSLFKVQSILVIDVGTCLKFEYVSAQAEYLGGAIAPGLNMRLTAMHNQTFKLPEVPASPTDQLIGNTTATAMNSGAWLGMLMEMEGRIERFLLTSPEGKIILTGGDHAGFAHHLKYLIFADPFLVLRGLYEIHAYNS